MQIHIPGGLVIAIGSKDVASFVERQRKFRSEQEVARQVGMASDLKWSALYESEKYQFNPDGADVIHMLPWALRRHKWTYRAASRIARGAFGVDGIPVRVDRHGIAAGHNLIPTEGRNNILDVWLHGTSQTATWYIAPFEANYTVVAGLTAASFTADATESTAYDESTRVAFVEAAASSGSTTNSANKADFTFNATKTIYGCGLLSVSTKSSTSGVIASAAQFSSSQGVVDDTVLRVTATVSITSS